MQTSQIPAATAYPVRDGRSGVTNYVPLGALNALFASDGADAAEDALKRLLEQDNQQHAQQAVPSQLPLVPSVRDNVQQDLVAAREAARLERHADREAFAQQRAVEKRSSFQRALRDAQPREAAPAAASASNPVKQSRDTAGTTSEAVCTDEKLPATAREAQSLTLQKSERQSSFEKPPVPSSAPQPEKSLRVGEQPQTPTISNAEALQATPTVAAATPASRAQQATQVPQAAATGGAVRATTGVDSKASGTTQRALEVGTSETKAANRATTRAAANAKPSEGAEEARQEVRIEQMLRVLKAQIHRKDQRAIIHLRPQELGPVKVDLQFSGGSVGIRIEAESSAARNLLSKHIEALRSGLESAGIRVEGLVVGNASEATTSDAGSAFADSGNFSKEAPKDDTRQESASSSGTRLDKHESTATAHEDRAPVSSEIAAQDARINLVA